MKYNLFFNKKIQKNRPTLTFSNLSLSPFHPSHRVVSLLSPHMSYLPLSLHSPRRRCTRTTNDLQFKNLRAKFLLEGCLAAKIRFF